VQDRSAEGLEFLAAAFGAACEAVDGGIPVGIDAFNFDWAGRGGLSWTS
jgi:hypothetical protein